MLFGIALSFSPLLFKRWIGERAAWMAAFFLAVSPASVFYSRYAIHETGFALACVLFLYYWYRARQEGLVKPLVIGLGVSIGFMASMKETFVIFIASVVLAEIVVFLMPKVLKVSANDAPMVAIIPSKKLLLSILGILGIALSIVTICFTAMGKDLVGFENFFKAFYFWSDTGSKGNGHQKPFYYWLTLFGKYEWLALVGLTLSPLALVKVKTEVRLLSVLACGLWFAYSIISYKTPWCMLSFYFLLVMVGTYWISFCMNRESLRKPLGAIFAVGLVFSAYQSYDVAYVHVDADDHPYIYGQTYRAVMEPIKAILEKKEARIQIISKYTWPLPWVLGEIKKTAYHTDKNPPAVLDADYLFIDADLDAQFSPRISGNYQRNVYRARQWAAPMVIYERR